MDMNHKSFDYIWLNMHETINIYHWQKFYKISFEYHEKSKSNQSWDGASMTQPWWSWL